MENYLLSFLFLGFSLISTIGLSIRLVLGSHRYVSAVLESDFFYDNQTESNDNLTHIDTYISEKVNQEELTYKKAA